MGTPSGESADRFLVTSYKLIKNRRLSHIRKFSTLIERSPVGTVDTVRKYFNNL